ncbi:MAG TPA: hypothetical protein VGN20_20410 [Mucilaginibacter sp.]
MDIESFYSTVKTHVNSKRCEKHHMSPYITFINGKIKLICCCADFKLSCYNEINLVLTGYQALQA